MKKYSFDYDWNRYCEDRKITKEYSADKSTKTVSKSEISAEITSSKNCVASKKAIDTSLLNIQNCDQFDENYTSKDLCTIKDVAGKECSCSYDQESAPSHDTRNRSQSMFKCCKTCVFYDDTSGNCSLK